ncbi:MAG: NAD-glutamate dehydrogenase [Gemmatimonadetes bacterium]|nr:NAD-glutamate dehydrogenase [Gemmatimonadota bacterium]
MSDTTEAAPRATRPESPVVAAVCRALENVVGADELPLVTRVAQIFLRKVPPELPHERGPEVIARMVLGGFRFLDRCRPDRVDAEVFNPELDNEGWTAPVTVIRTNISDRPFIVDTIREYLHSQDVPIEHLIYPTFHVGRDPQGRIVEIRPAAEGPQRESLVHCEVPRITDEAERARLRREIASALQDVVRATDDFGAMIDALNDTVAYLADLGRRLPERAAEIHEIQEFLRWLRDGGMVLLGFRAYNILDDAKLNRAIVVEPGSGLGILRNEATSSFAEPVPLNQLPPGLRELVEGGPLLIINKTNALSTVHRRARMDYVGVKKLDEQARVAGEFRFLGLFTSQAYGEDADRIPILREKLRQILKDAGAIPGTHDYKEINTIFNSMPKEELFLASAAEIGADIRAVLTLYHTGEVRVTLREDPLRRGVSVMVILPKDRFSGEVRRQIEEAFVRRFQGEVLNYHLALGGGDQARLHFYIAVPPQKIREVEPGALERIVQELIRTWVDRLREGLEALRPPDEARRLARRYGEALTPEYQAATDPRAAVRDILELEAMHADGRSVAISLANGEDVPGLAAGERVTKLNLYLRGERLILSDFMPILDNVGLRVVAVSPFEVLGRGVPDALIYVFAVQDAQGQPIELESRGRTLSEAILAVRAGDALNDPLNALVLQAGLRWREVDVLRAYAGYAFQLGAVPSRPSLPGALCAYPSAAKLLFRLFETKFDPSMGLSAEARERQAAEIRTEFARALDAVKSLADDRALRRLMLLIDATVRTNYYRNGGADPHRRSGGVPYISFKIATKGLEGFMRSKLVFEVWTHSARMEGIHLRGARVARGGIRYSDRPDDFRTEILGLVKTQMVKNAVIVPGGSKGGLITRRSFAQRDAMAEEVTEQYRTLVRGMLDLTDNLKDGQVIPPPATIVWDEPDPYIVVAADKGTAHLSDVANAVAAEYEFWLADAFASGGSHGYDHKKVGITARGVWESVRRHFREKGKDIQREPFTVVGIGDMSGDVFGNGMLLSRQIQLIAAFDHRHVFVDPSPDPERSYRERERLFRLPRSSWADYDRGLLSEGAFIVPRGAKEVRLSPEARQALGLPDDVQVLDGESLVRALLKAPAELLYNGGIGTYVKASDETPADVGDPPNDAVRVSAPELRVQVVAEGGNLGLTQAARVEYALKGGRLNTDALDNCGGVDMSDHEVNLKILLNAAVAQADLSMEERNCLLEELTEEVSADVLRDNESQSRAVSLDELRARQHMEGFRDLISLLERERVVDRADEGLPTWEELERRRIAGQTFTRPELCVLLAYSKLDLKKHLLASELPDDEAAQSYLVSYFPPAAVKRAGTERLAQHRLRREIIACRLTNDLVGIMGSAFGHRAARDSGHTPAEVARAWVVASELSAARALQESLRDVEATRPTVPPAALSRWLLGLSRVLDRTTHWVLANVSPEAPTVEVIAEHLEGLATLRGEFHDIVMGDERGVFEERVREIHGLTGDENLGRRLVTLRFLDQLLEILRVGRETGADVVDVGRAYYRMSELMSMPWLRQAILDVAGQSRWDQRVANALIEDVGRAHRGLTAQLLAGSPKGSVEERLESMIAEMGFELVHLRALLEEIRTDERPTLSAFVVAVREMEALSNRR